MPKLQITTTFLSGAYHGKEWPPSPMRLFQALIAGHNQGRSRLAQDYEFEKAMMWLECLQPPQIWACEAGPGSACRKSVPNNDDDIAMVRSAQGRPEKPNEKAKRYTFKTSRPWLLDENRSVHYLWEVPAGDESPANAVARYASEVIALGWGVDMVFSRGIISSKPYVSMGSKFNPHPGQGQGRELRVPCKGSYLSSEQRYEAFLRSGWQSGGLTFAKPPVRYDLVRYLREDEMEEQHFRIYQLLDLAGRNPYVRDPREAITVAAMMRHAVNNLLRREKLPPEKISELMGHGTKGNQVYCLPLPSVGHRHADGMIRRVLLKTPDAETLSLVDWGLDGYELELQNRPVAILSTVRTRDSVAERFISGSLLWETAIPVVLPGYDLVKGKKARTEKLILRALIQSGLMPSNLETFWFQRLPWHAHGHRAGDYKTAQYMRFPQYHLKIRFRKEVSGPVMLGAGRYLGLGLMSRAAPGDLAKAA
jgi:CRISPR-associated protein Csb2